MNEIKRLQQRGCNYKIFLVDFKLIITINLQLQAQYDDGVKYKYWRPLKIINICGIFDM